MSVVDDPYTAIEKRSLDTYVPLKAMMELTYRCNFRCVMCYLVEFRSPGELNTKESRGVLDQLADMGCIALTLTGGEPMVRKDFFEIAEYAREKRFALRLFTNGSRIDRSAADRLQAIRPLSTEISLYGMSEETYAAVTGQKGQYAKAIAAVRMLRERDLAVTIKMPVLKQNLHDVEALHRFAQEVGAGMAANPNITPKDDGDFSPLDHALDDDQLAEYYRQFVKPRANLPLKSEGLMCNTARNSMVISPTGDVFPCVQIKRAVGNVRSQSLDRIWSGSPLLDRLRSLRVKDYPSSGGCSSSQGSNSQCSSSQCDSSQCVGIAQAATGSFTGGDPLAARLEVARQRAHRGA